MHVPELRPCENPVVACADLKSEQKEIVNIKKTNITFRTVLSLIMICNKYTHPCT